MKLSWLLPALLGGGAAANLDKAGVAIDDKVLSVERKVILGKAITYQDQDKNDGASIRSASANGIPVALDTLHVVLPKNQTKPGLNVHQRADAASIITVKSATNAPPNPEHPSTQQTEPSDPNHNPHPDDESSAASPAKRTETQNPASANRAIAGMGVGLVSVMLIFTVFL